MKFCCEICGTPLGYIDTEKIAVPMTGDMFLPLMPGRNLPPPFQSGRPWELLYCRQCKARAFHDRDHVVLIADNGKKTKVAVDEIREQTPTPAAQGESPPPESGHAVGVDRDGDLSSDFTCECGKTYKHQTSLHRHQKECTWQKKTA